MVILAVFATFIAPQDPNAIDIAHTYLKPGAAGHIFGTDSYGRDLFSRIVYGARISIFVAIGGTIVGAVIGVLLGLVAGFFGGIVDSIIMDIENEATADCAKDEDGTPEARSASLSWQVGSEGIGYVASAGHLDIIDERGVLEGKMFNVSYVATDIAGTSVDPRKRPVTFAYNGGPGSASVPINFGGIGPRRVKTKGVSSVALTPDVEDNPCTLLRESDLVFLDALGTGWSFVAAGYDKKHVYGLEEDARTFCRAITQWLEENDRWDSPVYIFGESYGTMRSAVLMSSIALTSISVSFSFQMFSSISNIEARLRRSLLVRFLIPSTTIARIFFILLKPNERRCRVTRIAAQSVLMPSSTPA